MKSYVNGRRNNPHDIEFLNEGIPDFARIRAMEKHMRGRLSIIDAEIAMIYPISPFSFDELVLGQDLLF